MTDIVSYLFVALWLIAIMVLFIRLLKNRPEAKQIPEVEKLQTVSQAYRGEK